MKKGFLKLSTERQCRGGLKVEIDEKRLRELVIKAIKLIEAEHIQNIVIPKKKLYVILTEEWNGQYWSFFEKLNEQNEYDVYAVISSKINNNLHLNNLKKFQVCKGIVDEKDMHLEHLHEYLTVFPIVPRNIIVKTALCIDDTFETKWIFKCMENGQRIIFIKSGFEKFSGKEPLSYKNKILDYYRTLLEFDIEITDFIMQKEKNVLSIENNSTLSKESYSISSTQFISNYNENLKENKLPSKKKVITEKEIGYYAENNQIILNSDDIITDMARDKARSLNISIIRL